MLKNIIFSVFVVVFISLGFFMAPSSKIEGEVGVLEQEIINFEISVEEVVSKIKNGEDFVLIDVRTFDEYNEGHIINSILLPIQHLTKASLEGIGVDENMKDKEIVLYCRSGNRSGQAYEIMSSLGFSNVKSMAGGISDWTEKDLLE